MINHCKLYGILIEYDGISCNSLVEAIDFYCKGLYGIYFIYIGSTTDIYHDGRDGNYSDLVHCFIKKDRLNDTKIKKILRRKKCEERSEKLKRIKKIVKGV